MKKVTLVMLALTAVMQLPAQEQGRTLSLEEALEMTLSDNPAIRAAEFNRRAATTGAPRCHRSAYAADRHHGQLRLSG